MKKRLGSMFHSMTGRVKAATAPAPSFGDVGALGDRPDLPFPPLELRTIVGPTETDVFDNPSGERIWGDLDIDGLEPGEAYRRIFDFGCGCGRNARQLLLQSEPPERYVGIDVHPGMIRWCQENLERPGVEVLFDHHDVWSPTYAPGNTRRDTLPIRQYGSDFTMVNAHSVFTHLYERQTEFYLEECLRMIGERGVLRTTWFFFNREWFPVLSEQQNTLFVNDHDPSQAVYYDWGYFLRLIRRLKLRVAHVNWTLLPGFQCELYLRHGEQGPIDDPPGTVLGFGDSRPPARLDR
ncbi:MAG: class I SAM-dependent methyltransferase [Acidobacteriota bacterium]